MRAAESQPAAIEIFAGREKAAARRRLSIVGTVAEKPNVDRFDLLDLNRGLFHVAAENPRARDLALTVELPQQTLSCRVGIAVADAVARAALEATRVVLPLAVSGTGPAAGVQLRVEEGPGQGARLSLEKGASGAAVVRAAGGSHGLARLIRDWTGIGWATEGPAGEGMRRLRGRIEAALSLIGAGTPSPARVAARAVRRWLTWPPETERLMELVRRVPAGRGAVQGMVLVSRPTKDRAQLRRAIERVLRAKGYDPAIVVLNAYKPGLSWLREIVQPALQAIPRLERVRISFREFAPDRKALEMGTRWLQEIYPGPDLLAGALGLPMARVRLSRRRRLGEAYVVTAWVRGGAEVYQAGFTPRVSRLPYLPGHPALGWVHPSTGGIRLVGPAGVLADQNVFTDRECFWRFFQMRILPALDAAMAVRVAGGDLPPAFWEEAAFDVRIPETDERLGMGEERIAPLEALHEDLYFVLLDHFRLFVEKHGLPVESQFGRILPRVSATATGGKPQVGFRARPLAKTPAGFAAPATAARIASIGMEAGRLAFEIEAGDRPAAGAAARLRRAARSLGMKIDFDKRMGRFVLRTARPRPAASAGRRAVRKAALPAPPLDRRLSLREVERQVDRLGRLPHIGAWRAGTSWQERGIWALEVSLAGGEGLVSVARSRLLKPTLLLNARHHANEVSSTNAALRLAWELAATPAGRGTLKRVNVAIVPLENPDGVATLEELLPGCEGHKLHAARYNALGAEWYGDYFMERPRFPEARVKPRLWRRWLPLLVLDAHGVPSHEWDQPFSGYAPGRFRPFWIPRAFIYAIMPFIDDPAHPGHQPARDISRAMARAIHADRAMRDLDRGLKDRYMRYARSWDPEVFPPAGGSGLTVLPSEKRLAGLNFGAQRFPITLSEVVTEVTDEVAAGRLLELCARAHLTAAKALLDWLGRQAQGRVVRKRGRGGGLVLAWEAGKRKR